MATRLTDLFEPKSFARVYPTVRDELVAVRDRVKAIAFEVWSRDELDNDDYRELLDLAMQFDLTVVHQPTSKRRDADVFVYVLYPEQTWRILAHQALRSRYERNNGGKWSDGAEILESHLLGYTDDQIATWIATKRHERLGWGQQTVFLLLDEQQRATAARVAGRYLDPSLFTNGLELFFATGERVIRRDAHRLVGDRSLARIAIDWTYFRRTFGTDYGKRRVVTVELGPANADALNAALEDRVQLLGDDGWSTVSPGSSSPRSRTRRR